MIVTAAITTFPITNMMKYSHDQSIKLKLASGFSKVVHMCAPLSRIDSSLSVSFWLAQGVRWKNRNFLMLWWFTAAHTFEILLATLVIVSRRTHSILWVYCKLVNLSTCCSCYWRLPSLFSLLTLLFFSIESSLVSGNEIFGSKL